MRFRLAAAALAVCLSAWAQTFLTVEQLNQFIQSSVQMKQPDKQVASFLGSVKMKERLDDRMVEELQAYGIGPRTVQALKALRDASASLPAAKPVIPKAPPAPIPPPSSEEQAAILNEAREIALNYSKSLPNFICTQVTRRYFDPSGMEFWHLGDTLTLRLSYFEQKEDYKLILVNNTPTQMAYSALGGATSSGEFGTMLRELFEPRTQAHFEWDHWATLRGHRALVFSYRVAQPYSQFHVDWQRQMDIVTAYRGLVYIERDTHMVLRLTMEAIDIPPSFPVQQAKTVLDYDYQKISEHEFLLPLRAEVRMRADKELTKNDTEFRMYRRFSAETEIKYETPEPLPESQTKEQPPSK